ncbi:patatin-like phospholipase family protein [Chitinimonas lacunae]|uniref:Patatin-like phospholipase family protein n=1 Tax=Chitinimonas lacunae TaxID=1963018 RepID=A0ABV8MR35_9NEIS
MAEPVIFVFQGGGALGAFECGVYRELVPYLQARGHRIAALAGASIGAINAAYLSVRQQEADWGAQALETFWREQLSTPALPFLPPLSPYLARWNGLLTNLLSGNPQMFCPNWPGWLPASESVRFFQPLYRTEPMANLLDQHIGPIGPVPTEQPLLLVRTVDVERQATRSFINWRDTITPNHLRASASLPMLFPPVEIDGTYYWDGAFWPQTALREVLNALQQERPPGTAPESYWLIVVDTSDTLSQQIPVSALKSSYRLLGIMFGNRADYDEAAIAMGNRYIELVNDLTETAMAQPDQPWARRILAEAARIERENRCPIRCTRIRRTSLPHEHISRDLDYSPDRIDQLIAQGAEAARAILREVQHH